MYLRICNKSFLTNKFSLNAENVFETHFNNNTPYISWKKMTNQ